MERGYFTSYLVLEPGKRFRRHQGFVVGVLRIRA